MRPRLTHFFVLLGLTFFAGCSGGDDAPKSTLPPAPTTPAAPASPFDGYQVIQVTDGGSISGTISVSGPIPKLPPRRLNKDSAVCGTGSRESQQLVVKSGGLKNAVVIVQGVGRGKGLTAGPQTATIDQKTCEYAPHVMVVPVKTELSVLNSDPILHNIHTYQDDETVFNIAQPAQNQINKHTLQKAGFVYAECDVHGWMQAHIAVVDNPYYAITDENGKFIISDLPPGTYKIKVWHEYLGEKTQDVTVAAKSEAALNVDLKDLLDAKRPPAITAAPAASPAAPAGSAAAAAPSEVTVQMKSEGRDFSYDPPNLTIKVGTTVRWVNVSDNRHTATADPKFEKKAGEAMNPAGVDPWSSPFLPNGESFTRTFTVPGQYQYFCRNHEQFGMVGKITVVP